MHGVLSSGGNLVVECMRIVDNGAMGIRAQDSGSVAVSNSNISRNNHNGVDCARYCRVENNMIAVGPNSGVALRGPGGILLGNTISGHVGALFLGQRDSVAFGNNTLVGNVQASSGTAPAARPQPATTAAMMPWDGRRARLVPLVA